MKSLAIFLSLFIISFGLHAQTAKEYFYHGIKKSDLQDYRGAIA
jgi:hypothetical protein